MRVTPALAIATSYDPNAPPQDRWPLGPVLMVLAGLWFAFTWPWLSGAVTIPWDGKAHFAPQVQMLAASLARGEWPWWTPNVFTGHPQIADPQSMMFSPPMLTLALVNGAPSIWAIDVTVLLTVLFGGTGVVVFAWLQRWHWAGALIAAMIFMFGGSMAWRLQHFGQVMSLSYMPFALVALWLAVRYGAIAAGLAAGALGAAIILGRDQVGLLAVYTLAAYAIVLLATQRRQSGTWLKGLVALCAGAVFGVALIAIPVGLTLLLAEHSNRPSIDLAGAGAGSLHPALLMTLVSANLYGSAGDMADFWGPPSFHWDDTGLFTAQNMGVIYLSTTGLLALSYGALRGWVRHADTAFFAIAAGVWLIYALGWYTPVFALAHDFVPGIDKFRRPADATFLVGGLLAFVIGAVTHRFLLETQAALGAWDRPATLKSAHAGTLGIMALALLAAVALATWQNRIVQALEPLAMAAIAIVVTLATLAGLKWLWPIRPILAAGLLVAVVTADLRINNGPNGATALPAQAIDMLNPNAPPPVLARVKTLLASTTSGNRRDRIEILGLGYHWPNVSLTHGLENTLGANPVRLSWYTRATGAGDTVANLSQRTFSPLMPDYGAAFTALLGLRYVVARNTPEARATAQDKGLTVLETVGPHVIFETPHTLPRALFVRSAQSADFSSVLNTGRLPPDIDFTETVLLDAAGQSVADAPRRDTEYSESGRPIITSYTNTRVVVTLTASSPGWLVLHDVWHPWWQATVNGTPAKVLRANVIFRAVQVPAGRHSVTFTFAPISGALRQLTASDDGEEDAE